MASMTDSTTGGREASTSREAAGQTFPDFHRILPRRTAIVSGVEGKARAESGPHCGRFVRPSQNRLCLGSGAAGQRAAAKGSTATDEAMEVLLRPCRISRK